MAQFASSDDLAARLGLTLSDEENARADILLELASGLIQQEVRQQIELDTTTIVRRSTASDRFRLPERPVLAVTSVKLKGPGDPSATVVDPNSYYVDDDEVVRRSSRLLYPELVFTLWGRGWLGPSWELQVTYEHGYADTPPLVRGICLEMVVRAWTNPSSVAQESVGNTSTLYYYAPSRPTGLLMADTEIKALNDFFRRKMGTTVLR